MTEKGNPLSGSRIVYLFVYVNDLAASRSFYEEKLGLRVLEEDAVSVKYDVGEIILALNKAKDYGIEVRSEPDDTSIIVFHVDDIDAMRSALEKRGVEFSGETDRYDIGATATFYDLDGHCLSLYEPSPEALMWPSGDRIRAILSANGAPSGQRPAGEAAAAAQTSDSLTLGARKMIYLFLFVRDVAEAATFYGRTLNLPVVEESPEAGVAKYNAGGIILATHLVASEEGARAKPEDLQRPKGIAPVFHVSGIQSVFDTLSKKEVRFTSHPAQSEIGTITRFEDPSGHVFYLYEPSDEALGWPSGSKIKRVLAQKL